MREQLSNAKEMKDQSKGNYDAQSPRGGMLGNNRCNTDDSDDVMAHMDRIANWIRA
jgi:hypothetical protein